MAAGGRPAKPTSLKVLDGDKPSRINRQEPTPSTFVDLTIPPDYLSPEAAQKWREIAPDRVRTKVLTEWDIEAFGAFCEALVMLRTAHIGALVLAKPGQESPMSKFRQVVNICSTLGGRFGWTPADRQKLAVTGEDAPVGAGRLLA